MVSFFIFVPMFVAFWGLRRDEDCDKFQMLDTANINCQFSDTARFLLVPAVALGNINGLKTRSIVFRGDVVVDVVVWLGVAWFPRQPQSSTNERDISGGGCSGAHPTFYPNINSDLDHGLRILKRVAVLLSPDPQTG